MDNNYYTYELEQEVDNFKPQTVIDWILGTVVVLTIIVCLILNIIHICECTFEKKIEKVVKKMEDEEEKHKS